jgi:putative transposase
LLINIYLCRGAEWEIKTKWYDLSNNNGSGAYYFIGQGNNIGVTGTDNRVFVDGCLWVLRCGAHWCNLPERYGNLKTVPRHFSRWCHAGALGRVFEALTVD